MDGVTLKSMLIVYAIGSGIIWIKTFCLSSYHFASVNSDTKYSVFDDSLVGRLFGKNKKIEITSYWDIQTHF